MIVFHQGDRAMCVVERPEVSTRLMRVVGFDPSESA
jgi:hypothetical protein